MVTFIGPPDFLAKDFQHFVVYADGPNVKSGMLFGKYQNLFGLSALTLGAEGARDFSILASHCLVIGNFEDLGRKIVSNKKKCH